MSTNVSLSRLRSVLGAASAAIAIVAVTFVAPVPAVAAPALPAASPLDPLAASLALHYDFADAVDDLVVSDVSGHGKNGTIVGAGATSNGTAIDLSANTYVEIPSDVFENQNTLTISTWLRNDQANGDYAALFFGSPVPAPPAQYWLFNPANPAGKFKSVITNGYSPGAPWSTESGVLGPVTSDPFALYTTVITATSVIGYINGEKVGTAAVARTVTEFGTDLVAYIGKSTYNDPTWDGAMADLKVYTAAMTDQQAAVQYYQELGDSAVSQAAVDADAAALAVANPAEVAVVLPTVGAKGSSISWVSSHPEIITATGSFVAPASSDETVTLTATLELAGKTATRQFQWLIASTEVIPDSNLVVHYALDETSGTVAADSSGNGLNATYVGGPALRGDAGVALDGVDDYVDLPDNILQGLDSITVSIDVLVNTAQGTPYFIYGLGNTNSSGVGNGYLMAGGNPYRSAISTGNWSFEQSASSGSNLTRGVWKTLTYTLDDASDLAKIYLDGVQVGQLATTTKPSQIGGGITTANYIGRSNYTGDKRLFGSVRDFRMYDIALDATAVAALVPDDATRVERDMLAIDLGDTSNVTGNLVLPTTALNGSTVVWSSSTPAVVAANGAVTRPSYSAGDAQVTLTATVTKGSVTDTRQFLVVVRAMADDQSIADAAADALIITNIDDVRGNITLPTTINGLSVTWTTSNGAVVTTDGVVTRKASDTDVTLTATITKGSATAQRVFVAKVKAEFAMAALEGYAFAYFTGNSIQGEKIYFAASDGNDAMNWDELYGGNPLLESKYGEKGLRDPFVIRSPEGDTFYLIATDLSIGGGTTWDASQRQGSLYLEIWESHDMVNWSEQRHVKVSPDTAGNTWAPEAYYDESLGEYVVFWASKLYAESDPGHSGSTYNRMMYATTRDFVTFSEAKIWQDGTSRIDSTVTRVDGTYYRFTKDEGGGGTGCSDIIQESSTDLLAPLSEWDYVTGCIGRDAGTSAVEGPSIFHSNPGDVNGDYDYLFVDEYGGRGYIPLRTADIANPSWRVAPTYDLPASPRHGTVIPVTAQELAALRANIDKAPTVVANANGEVLRYNFESGAGTTITDVTGNGYDGKIVGDATLSAGQMTFTGNDYVDVPDHIMSGIEDITIEAEVYVDSTQSGNYFIYGLGNTTSGGVGNGYLFTSGNNYRTSLATGNWSTEQTVNSGKALPRNQWVTMTYTLQGNTARLFLDGVQVATGTVTTDPTDIGNSFTTANYLGKSNYSADGLFKGKYREFAIYNRALSPAEVLANAGRTDVLLDLSLADSSALKLDPIVDQEAHTVVFPVEPGTDLTALAPVFDTVAGVTAAPASGTVRDLSSPVTMQLSGASTAMWTMSAVEMRSPILPGYYADPNVFAYGDTYYIYATTDGYSGWGGKDFYVWSSKDLVDWTRSSDPILTLDGAAGNVPWASGNAWAPTIIEREGKFYFYFSGHNDAYGRKTIGVAVADSPEGPFVAQPAAMILNNEAVTSGQAIDPAAFLDPETGKYYLFWGNGSPVFAELADDMVSLVPGTIKSMSGLTGYREGSFPVYRDGLYHMTYSVDDTGSTEYRVGYATATSVDGPWTYRGVILAKNASLGILGTGHNSILNVPGTDDWYIVYHRFGMPGGNGTHRETTIDRLTFDPETGLIQVVTPTLSAVPAQTIVDADPLHVSIAGTSQAGQTLTAQTQPAWTAVSYQWAKNGVDIPGATGETLALTGTDAGADVTVTVTASKPGWPSSTKTSSAVEVTRPAPTSVEVTGPLGLLTGETAALAVGVAPAFADQSVTWSSSNDAIATVNAVGVVTAHAVGHVTITAATVVNPAITGSLAIDVTSATPAWSKNTIYTQGDLVSWNGAVYKALWWTKGTTPSASTTGAWAKVGADVRTDSGVYREWTSSWIYVAGDVTVHNGHLWRAKWWQRGTAPYASAWGAWADLGPVTLTTS